MRVKHDTIRAVVEHRYGDVMTERQKENMVARVQAVIESGWQSGESADVCGIVAASIHRETYEGVKR